MFDHAVDGIRLELQRTEGGGGRCVITVDDPELLGHDADLVLALRAEVKDSRPVNSERELFATQVHLAGPRVEVPVPASALCCYSYDGSRVRLALRAELSIDDGILFDSKAETEPELAFPDRPQVRDDPEALIEPADAFDFAENFQAIPLRNREIVTVLMAVALLVAGVNTLLGLHDQLAPEGATYFYSHVDSDGDSQSPLFNSLVFSGAAGGLLWLAIRAQLRRYMRFELAFADPLRRHTTVPARSLVRGVARCDLEDVTVRVVAANRERGQFKRGSGTDERTVSFETPVRAVLLYERRLRRVPAGAPVETYLDGEVGFEPMFAALYPPVAVGSHHGIDVVWEVQLLHPDFVDQEVSGDCDGLVYEDFLEA